MPNIQFHCSIRENDVHSTANMAAVVGNKHFRWSDVKSFTSYLEAFEKLTYFGI